MKRGVGQGVAAGAVVEVAHGALLQVALMPLLLQLLPWLAWEEVGAEEAGVEGGVAAEGLRVEVLRVVREVGEAVAEEPTASKRSTSPPLAITTARTEPSRRWGSCKRTWCCVCRL
jgi:hypothetical protein